MKKAKVDGRIIDIIDSKYAISHGSSDEVSNAGVIHEGIIYPIRNKNDNRPGYYIRSRWYGIYRQFNKQEEKEYIATEENIIDFSDKTKIRDIINTQNKLRSMESAVLTSADNITIPIDDQHDRPEILGLKEAIRCKHIDLDKYAPRFGANYNNDRRLLDKNSITLAKLIAYGNALDMEISLTFKDKSPDIPNPIGKEITVIVTDTDDSATE